MLAIKLIEDDPQERADSRVSLFGSIGSLLPYL
jgi:hypothetical protein